MTEKELDRLLSKSFYAQFSGQGWLQHTYSGSYEDRRAYDTGTADWTGSLYGVRVDLECKVSNNKPTLAQQNFLLRGQACGSVAAVVAHHKPSHTTYLVSERSHLENFTWADREQWTELSVEEGLLGLAPLRLLTLSKRVIATTSRFTLPLQIRNALDELRIPRSGPRGPLTDEERIMLLLNNIKES